MLAQTAPMGWNSWNTFASKIDEKLIFEIADTMVEKGYRDAGYEYLVIDDCWALKERDADGRLVADPEKFPHGMKFIADYVHGKGLKFGMYSCAGTLTCAGYPSSFDHEFVDAQTFADWGVDFLKYDFCHFPKTANGRISYRRMAMALRATGRPILFSACNWGTDDCWEWMRSAGAHMYRSTGDIVDNFKSVMQIADSQEKNLGYSAPGCYNDMDMLVVGMYGKGHVGLGGCSDAQYRTHFALWCLFGVPLMIGSDIRNQSEETEKILKNPRLIAIDQDPEARPPFCTWREGSRRSYIKNMADGTYVLAYFNPTDTDATVWMNFEDAGLDAASGYQFKLTDVWTGEEAGTCAEYFNPFVPAYDCKIYRAELVKR